ncbi:MAG TPA: carboxypeptidase regulatory-like domain-containing protein [Salinivirgaceae bacterium]|nr:carboxypeptidase regulatory-like domain-containing protein [Salinivirgaceae bacterium]
MKRFFNAAIAGVIVAMLISSCTDDQKVTLSGKVVNYTEHGVISATVELLSGSSVEATVQTDEQGNYELKVKEGSYTLRAVASGYNETTESIDLTVNTEKNITLYGSATLSGRILNSQTGQGVANAEIKLNRQTDSKDLIAVYEIVVITDYQGYFTINYCPVGVLVGVIQAPDFLSRPITWTSTTGSITIGDVTVVAPVAEGEIRIVLSWGENPTDLDSHLTGPTSSETRFHCYYANRNVGVAMLDVDDVTSYGPETITITQLNNGSYRYSVHNYSDQTMDGGLGIYQSPTLVEVYNHTGLIYSFTAPAFSLGSGNTWRVFEFQVANGTITQFTPINTYVYASSSGDTDIFKSVDKKDVKMSDIDF